MSRNLENPSLVNDKMKNDLMNQLVKSANMVDTSTNMLVSHFGNEIKLINEEDRKNYNDEDSVEYQNDVNDADEPDKLDDDVESYRDKRANVFKHIDSDAKEFVKQKKLEQSKQTKSNNDSSEKKNNYNDPSSDKVNEANEENFNKSDDPSQWSKKEMQIKKLDMLRKLGELAQRGVKISYNYNMDSDYDTMKFEYDLHTGIRAKNNSVNWMSNMLIGIVKGVELLNDNVNPFDIKFEGTWSNKVTHDIREFQDVIGELYEKYTVPGKPMSPELKLFLMLSGSAISVQMYKGIAQSSNTSEKINSNPDKIKELRRKADSDKLNETSDSVKSVEKSETSSQKKLNQQHENAARIALDYHTIKNSEKEYDNIRQRAKKNNVGLNDGLIMSESVRSTGTKSNKGSTNFNKNNLATASATENNSTDANNQKINFAELKNEMRRNQSLMQAEKLLNGFEEAGKKIKSEMKKKSMLRGLKTTESVESSESEKSSISIKSSSSSAYINPDIKNILGPVISNQKQLKNKSEKSTESSKSKSSSSSVSSSSIKKGLVIDSDEIRSSDEELKNVKKNTSFKFDDRITKEMISFGKKSNDNSTTGSKRGRPKKEPLNIKIGS